MLKKVNLKPQRCTTAA